MLAPEPDLWSLRQSERRARLPAAPVLTVAHVVIVVSLLLLPARRLSDWYVVLPLLMWMVLGMAFFWDRTPESWSGAVQYLGGILAWVVGMRAARAVLHSERSQQLAVRIVSIALAIEFLVVAMQAAGVPLNPMESAQAEILDGRFNGTMFHPNDLGKAVVFLLVLLLVLQRDAPKTDRRLATIGVLAAIGSVTLTQGRVVIVCVIAALALWAVVQPKEAAPLSRKLTVLTGAALATAVSASAVIARFALDPEGGVREVTRDIAWIQITNGPWAGTGPNTYVTVVGNWNSLTASGVPVHDSALLIWSELGILGLACILSPLAYVALKCVGRFRLADTRGAGAIGFCILAVCASMIGATGWGLMGSTILPLFLFVMGFLAQVAFPTHRFPGASARGRLRSPSLVSPNSTSQ